MNEIQSFIPAPPWGVSANRRWVPLAVYVCRIVVVVAWLGRRGGRGQTTRELAQAALVSRLLWLESVDLRWMSGWRRYWCRYGRWFSSHLSSAAPPHSRVSSALCYLRGLLQLRFEHDTATTRYNTLRGFSCARIRGRIRESVVGVSCMLIDSSMHTAFTLYLYRPTLHRLHRVCEYARNCLYKRN